MNHHAGLAFILLKPDFDPQDPTTTNTTPPVVCFHGSGTNTHYTTWLPLLHQLSTTTPVLFYERRGIGAGAATDIPAAAQSPQEALQDLATLLHHLALPPPYIFLAHSHGGTFAREFLHHHPDQVAGMVLAETGQETPTAHDEAQYRNRALGRKPLSVIHADSLLEMREGAGAAGREELLARWAEEDERLKRAQLRLSANARYVRVEGCGHHVVRDRPDVVGEEVGWALNNLAVVTGKRRTGLRGLGECLGASVACLRRRKDG